MLMPRAPEACRAQRVLDRAHGGDAVVEDARDAAPRRRRRVVQRVAARAPRVPAPPEAIDRHVDRVRDRARELEVVARARAVAVDAREQDLAAPRRTHSRAHATASSSVGSRPPFVYTRQPSPSRFASMLATTHCDAEALGALGEQLRVGRPPPS